MSNPATTSVDAPTAAQLGAFCWIELHTRTRAQARAFFTKVVGWTIKSCDPNACPDGNTYEEWIASDGATIGGMMEMPEGVPAFVPPNFVTYVNVADVDASVARVPALGGKVLMPPMDIPNVGRFAVVADPTGACVNLFKGIAPHGTTAPVSRPGHFCWNELMTTDPAAAGAFYTALLGYSTVSMPMPSGEYTMFAREGAADCFVGGMMKSDGHSCWLPYVCVPNVDACVAIAIAESGRVLHGPCDVPGFGRSAVIADSSGAALGLFTPAA